MEEAKSFDPQELRTAELDPAVSTQLSRKTQRTGIFHPTMYARLTLRCFRDIYFRTQTCHLVTADTHKTVVLCPMGETLEGSWCGRDRTNENAGCTA